jgi:hypothetical protein
MMSGTAGIRRVTQAASMATKMAIPRGFCLGMNRTAVRADPTSSKQEKELAEVLKHGGALATYVMALKPHE